MSSSPTRPSQEAVHQAMGVIVSGVHKRAFLHKLAQLGHLPETESEADALVALGFKLAAVNPEITRPGPFVPPQPVRGKYASAVNALDEVLGTEKQAETDSITDAAYELASDPQIYAAALTIKQAAAAAAAPVAAG
jgi:hypothetical protein